MEGEFSCGISSHCSVQESLASQDERFRPVVPELQADEVPFESELHSSADQIVPDMTKYGELVVLGYNGSLQENEKGRRRSKYILTKRSVANGIRKSRHVNVTDVASSAPVLDSTQHSIAYTLSRNQSVVVLYEKDSQTDMFQIGRSKESQIDFVVMDTINEDEKNGDFRSGISRYACRLLIDRDSEQQRARVFAAGFDASSNIFLGENATQWDGGHGIDGLTTNGILVMHPKGSFCEDGAAGIWREVSVNGGIYGLRESRAARRAGSKIPDETNELKDGSLIDLCGATLLFRSVEGLSKSPTKAELLQAVDQLNAGRPQCPVGLNTLVLPSRATVSNRDTVDKQPYVYLKCGHVQGLHSWGSQNTNEKKCPMCFKCGPVVKLVMGIEPAFYVDCGEPNYAFNPCGHMASENTVKYWASVPTPHGSNGLNAICPFCATQLSSGLGYIRLIFQDNID